MPEMVWNAVKFIFIGKMREKSRRRQTGSSGELLWSTFGQIVNRARWVRKTGRRHIYTSGLASRALGTLFFALFWPVLSRYRISTARNAFCKKTGCTKSKSVARKYNSEVLSKVPEMVQKVAKLTVIRKTSWWNLKWICKTGNSCVLWPTFDVNTKTG